MYTCGALTALRSPDKVDLLDCLETRVCSGAALPDGWNETLFADAIDVRPRATAAASLRWSQPPSFRACVVVSVVRRGLDFRPFVYTSVTTSTPPSFLHAPKCTGCRSIVATLTLVIATDRCAKIAGTVPTGRELPVWRSNDHCVRSK